MILRAVEKSFIGQATILIILFSMITDSGADFSQFCTCSCAGFEWEYPLCGVCIGYACVTGEEEAADDRTIETSSWGEGKARPEKKLCAGRSVCVCVEYF